MNEAPGPTHIFHMPRWRAALWSVVSVFGIIAGVVNGLYDNWLWFFFVVAATFAFGYSVNSFFKSRHYLTLENGQFHLVDLMRDVTFTWDDVETLAIRDTFFFSTVIFRFENPVLVAQVPTFGAFGRSNIDLYLTLMALKPKHIRLEHAARTAKKLGL